MQVRGRQSRIDPAVWSRADMVSALGSRDIAGVYRVLQKSGVSQRRIAAMTGQSQSEISEILGGRKVAAYDVLARIADGLGVPRGRMGLAYDEYATRTFDGAEPVPVFDAGSGCWVVQVPVFVDSHEAAVGVCESLASARPTTVDDCRPQMSQDHLIARRWRKRADLVLSSGRALRQVS